MIPCPACGTEEHPTKTSPANNEKKEIVRITIVCAN